jgi:hypothetical protein
MDVGHTISRGIYWLILVHLDLDATPRGELGDDHRVGDLSEDRRVSLSTQSIVERMKVGRRDDELEMGGLAKSQPRTKIKRNTSYSRRSS